MVSHMLCFLTWTAQTVKTGGVWAWKGEVLHRKEIPKRRKWSWENMRVEGGREKGGQGEKELQEVEGEDYGWRIKLGSKEKSQRCMDSNAGDPQV